MADPSWGPVAEHPAGAPKRGSVRWFRRVVGAFAILIALCLVVGAGTLREEGYDVPKLPLVVVSRSADLPPTLRDAPRGRILMATVASSDGLASTREALGEENVLVLGDDEIDLALLKSELADRGWTDQRWETFVVDAIDHALLA